MSGFICQRCFNYSNDAPSDDWFCIDCAIEAELEEQEEEMEDEEYDSEFESREPQQ